MKQIMYLILKFLLSGKNSMSFFTTLIFWLLDTQL